MGTAMVTPASASAYCSARLPKKMQKPEAMAKPMEDRFSCTKMMAIIRFIPPLVWLEGRKEDGDQTPCNTDARCAWCKHQLLCKTLLWGRETVGQHILRVLHREQDEQVD